MKELRAAEADNDVFEREMAERAEIAQGKWRDFLRPLYFLFFVMSFFIRTACKSSTQRRF